MMKAKGVFLVAIVLLLAGIGAFLAQWHGDASATVSWPISGSTVKFCGSATGGWVITGLLSLALGVVGLLLSVVFAVFDRVPRRAVGKS